MLDNPFENQVDIKKIKLLTEDSLISTYKVTQSHGDKTNARWVRVLHDISNHYNLRREKDLLQYLNQFKEDFPRFDEIRKVGFHYLQFFDYVGNRTLDKEVKKKGVLNEKQARLLLENIVSALEKLHNVGFIHNDLRPENILVSKKHFYLTGLDRAIPMINSYEAEVLKGDQRYTPPEKMNGKMSESGDIYVLGCILYFAMTGKHIYRLKVSQDRYQHLYAHAFHTLRKENSLPYFWRQLVIWMTQKKPEKRPNLSEIQQWLQDQLVPKFIRDEVIVHNKKMSQTPLDDLANQHFFFALFQKANQHESEGNLESAFNLYESCAFQEYSRAENNLGLMYEKGAPVKQDYVRAMTYYHLAYQKGNPFAAYNLARLFEKGLGVEANLNKAFSLYEFSALRGHGPAQNKLAEFYVEGKVVSKDLVQARFWYDLAARYGCLGVSSKVRTLLSEQYSA